MLVVSSKSGGTVETDSHRRTYEKAFTDNGIDPKQRIVVVTDPGSPLQKTAEDAGYRKVFLADPNVGGRYSALTAFGLVPAGLAGVDIGALLDDADAAAGALATDDEDNPGLRLGALLGLAHNAGSDKVVFADFGSGIVGFGDWAEQLIAESTGKNGKGLLPVVVEDPAAPGFADAKTDAILVHLGGFDAGLPAGLRLGRGHLRPARGPDAAVGVRHRGSRPDHRHQPVRSAERGRGQEAIPGAARRHRRRRPRRTPAAGGRPDPGLRDPTSTSVRPGRRRMALEAFFAAAPDARLRLDPGLPGPAGRRQPPPSCGPSRRATKLQTTFGWGPRFLHSTGQYHKGGHQNGVFLQITGAVDRGSGDPGPARTPSHRCNWPRRPVTRRCWPTRADRCCTCT